MTGLSSPDEARLQADEVTRRLPALNNIEDPEIRACTAALSADAPEYFWSVPASVSEYHHPDCRGDHGLWAHTLMVVTAVERLAPSFAEQARIRWNDIDKARSAAILHDQRKNGDPKDPEDSSVSDHDLRMASVVRPVLGDDIADAIASHMGPWYDGPAPETGLEQLVHAADMIASTATITAAVPGPIPEELEDLGVKEVD